MVRRVNDIIAGGVDAGVGDAVTKESLEEAVRFAKDFARKTGAVAAITGAIDIVAGGERAFCSSRTAPGSPRPDGTPRQ